MAGKDAAIYIGLGSLRQGVARVSCLEHRRYTRGPEVRVEIRLCAQAGCGGRVRRRRENSLDVLCGLTALLLPEILKVGASNTVQLKREHVALKLVESGCQFIDGV